MRASEVRELTDEEIQGKAQELSEEIFRLRLRRGTGQIEDALRIRKIRRDIARVKTIQSERVRAANKERS
ncbi:MAG: 50S ribosomal protein L29 [Desulfurellaceae bacterium]|nr:50S ribosomal protein L29 [Desulfurellaceae bacterium]